MFIWQFNNANSVIYPSNKPSQTTAFRPQLGYLTLTDLEWINVSIHYIPQALCPIRPATGWELNCIKPGCWQMTIDAVLKQCTGNMQIKRSHLLQGRVVQSLVCSIKINRAWHSQTCRGAVCGSKGNVQKCTVFVKRPGAVTLISSYLWMLPVYNPLVNSGNETISRSRFPRTIHSIHWCIN